MMVLTADRPYESRDTGANKAIDQVKNFSPTYTRWFRDILPPSDDVPISAILSDTNHAVTVLRQLMGPVHLNVQFRENLAPDSGPIRNDDRMGSITTFNSGRFIDAPAFRRWSLGGGQWSSSYYSPLDDLSTPSGGDAVANAAIMDIADLMRRSKSGIIVVGNVRNDADASRISSSTVDIISDFAQFTGYPIFAGIQGGSLRNDCPAVVPYGDHVLKHPAVSQGMNTDFILQIGAPLISTEMGKVVSDCIISGGAHVLVHPHHPSERADPAFTVSHRVNSEAGAFLKVIQGQLESMGIARGTMKSDLSPLITMGKALGQQMPNIIHKASLHVGRERDFPSNGTLTEPQVVLAISEVLQDSSKGERTALCFSNSMPVRDTEFFLYPQKCNSKGPSAVAVNRGASVIDGIISSAAGYADASDSPTTLLVGDLATLHDLNAFHTLARSHDPSQHPHSSVSPSNSPPLTTVVINNDGGGIFSFLPIAKYGNGVGFEDYFGTPTRSFSFSKSAEAFGLPYQGASSYHDFKNAYHKAISMGRTGIVEAQVVGREANVAVHAEITRLAKHTIDAFLEGDVGGSSSGKLPTRLPIKVYGQQQSNTQNNQASCMDKKTTLLLLHGWMGDKYEWGPVATSLTDMLSNE
mmetsp:Transcript_6630/g.19589  ORF Transcript_6630/g.19589 Transcript_6630/m.19589 type:complete len:638 (+) Transcript_6630:1339-3252(+)